MHIPKIFLAALLAAAPAHADFTLIPIETLFKDPETYSFSISPDSRYLAGFLWLDGAKKLVLVDTSTIQTYVLIDFETVPRIHIRSYAWVDNDTLFLRYGKLGNADENLAFVDFHFTRGKPEYEVKRSSARGIVVDPLTAVEDTVLFAREPDPGDAEYRLYTITVNQLQESRFRDARESRYRLPDAIFYRMDPGSGYLLAATAQDELVQHWYLDDTRKRWIEYFEHDPAEFRFAPVGLLAGGKFAVLTNKDTDRMSLVEFDLADSTLGEVLYQHPRYDLVDAELDEHEGMIRSVSYVDHGRAATEYFTDTDSRLWRLLQKTFPQKHVQVVSDSSDGKKQVLFVSASDDPGTFYLLDTATGQANILASWNLDVEAYTLARSEVFNVASDDGKTIEAILTRPQEPNGVLLVNPHGGPVGVRDYASYNEQVQFFANRGYAVLNVNFRGSRGFGKEFMNRGRGQFGKLIEEDISAVVAQVMADNEFAHVCAIGTSYGGYSAMMLAIQHPDLYRCVIAAFGIFDLPLLFNESNLALLEEEQQSLEAVIGEYSEGLKDVSPFYLAERVKAPVLLLAGTEDDIADYEQTNRMKYRLQQLGKPVEYFYYENTGHGHPTWMGDRHEYALVDDFIRRTLELDPPAATNADELRGAEYSLIADYYEQTTFIDRNRELAFRYYQEAAALNHAYAIYRLASYHETGSFTEQDLDLAYDHLLQASELGSSGASYRLGRLYREGRDGNLSRDIDAARSFEFFSKARDQGHVLADFDIAQALCTGSGVEQDLDRCLSLLSLYDEADPDADAKARRRNSVFAEIAWSLPPGAEAVERISEFIGSAFEAEFSGIELKVVASGLLANGRLRGADIPAEEGTRFGVEFRVDTPASDGDRFAIKAQLTGPVTMDEKGRIVERVIRVGDVEDKTRITYRIADDPDRVTGEWRLDIRTLADEPLAEVSWRVGG